MDLVLLCITSLLLASLSTSHWRAEQHCVFLVSNFLLAVVKSCCSDNLKLCPYYLGFIKTMSRRQPICFVTLLARMVIKASYKTGYKSQLQNSVSPYALRHHFRAAGNQIMAQNSTWFFAVWLSFQFSCTPLKITTVAAERRAMQNSCSRSHNF